MSESKFKELYPEYADIELGVNEDGVIQILEPQKDYEAMWKIVRRSMYPEVYEYTKVEGRLEESKENKRWMTDMGWADDIEWINNQIAEYEEELQNLEATIAEKLDGMSPSEANSYLETPIEGYKYSKELKSGTACEVVGCVPTDVIFGQYVQIVVPDDQIDVVLDDIYADKGVFNIYTDDKESVRKYFEELPQSILNSINVIITDNYEDALSEYRAEKAELFNGRIIVTITIFFVSMIILYFMMKANAVQRMQDLGVYRLIGISKMSIIGLFAYENVLITSYTSLIGAVLATFVTNIIASIPSLDADINYPWYAFLGTIAFLYLSNVLIGILPIRKILRLPPAQLASKYDI